MRLIGLAVILTAGLTLTPLAAEAESAGKVYRIGFILTAAPDEAGHLVKALDEGLRELGYVIAAVKQATAKIPVVMAASRDPVGSGFIASVARPEGEAWPVQGETLRDWPTIPPPKYSARISSS